MPKKIPTHLDIVKNWLPRYTGMSLDQFGDYILLTNFKNYVTSFADQFNCNVHGEDRPMQAATNENGVTIINFGIGSPNAATMMDLLCATNPKGVLFLGKCGGLKKSSEVIMRQPKKTVLDLMIVTGAKYNNEVINTIKKNSIDEEPHIIKSAVVGIEGLKKIAFNAIIKFSGRDDTRAFNTIEEAKEWLVNN